jgi:hypothetical protein
MPEFSEVQRDYLTNVFAPELMACGMSKKCALGSVDYLIVEAEKRALKKRLDDLPIKKEAQTNNEAESMKAFLTTIGSGAGLGGLVGLAKSVFARGPQENLLDLLKNSLVNALKYGGIGAGITGVGTALMPEFSGAIGSQIRQKLSGE